MENGFTPFNLKSDCDAPLLGDAIKKQWLEKEQMPGVFRYNLNIRKVRVIEGTYRFLLQLNIDRGVQRRVPMLMESIAPPYDESKFNFTKIGPQEKLLDIRFDDMNVSIIINQSPISKFNSLIVPELRSRLPQVLTLDAIRFTIRLLRVLDSSHYKIAFNSPGAAASVNHLHLHMIYSEYEFFGERAELENIHSNVYKFSDKYEIRAICFLVHDLSSDQDETETAEKIYKLVCYMIEHIIPHNVLFVLTNNESEKTIRIVIYPQDNMAVVKSTVGLNVAVLELSGFVSLADETLYERFTERDLLDAIKERQRHSFEKILTDVKNPEFFTRTQR